jgi:proteasome assembly chaperone (PAC2) family protein
VSEVTWHATPTLRRPLFIAGFAGLFDIAETATAALTHLSSRGRPETIASIDPEHFFNFTRHRPKVQLDEDDVRRIRWPANEIAVLDDPAGVHDLVLLAGLEPDIRWRSFAEAVLDIVGRLNCELVVTVGAMADAIPHTRQPQVIGSTTNDRLARSLGLSKPRYQGPTGVVGVLHDMLDRTKVPAVSLRVPVPHYAAGTEHPLSTQALLRHLEHVTGVPTGHADLDDEVARQRRRLDRAVAADDDAGGYVAALEQRYDERMVDDLPSGDDLAAELERFLRDQDDDG